MDQTQIEIAVFETIMTLNRAGKRPSSDEIVCYLWGGIVDAAPVGSDLVSRGRDFQVSVGTALRGLIAGEYIKTASTSTMGITRYAVVTGAPDRYFHRVTLPYHMESGPSAGYPEGYVPEPLQPTPRTSEELALRKSQDFAHYHPTEPALKHQGLPPVPPSSAAAPRVQGIAYAFTLGELSTIESALVTAAAVWTDRDRAADAARVLGIFAAALRAHGQDHRFVEEPLTPADMVEDSATA